VHFRERRSYKGDLTLEQRIERSEHRWRIAAKAWAISYLILTVGLASALIGIWQASQRDKQQSQRNDYVICQNTNQARQTVRNFMITLIDRSDKTLDTLDYYKTHEAERIAAHAANAQARADAEEQLRDIPCVVVAKN